jgi:hexosaminidase
LDTIFQDGLYPWMFHLRNETDWEPSLFPLNYLKSLKITQTAADNSSTFKPLSGQVDESYELSIDNNGDVKITAVSSIGVVRALETFTQLFYTYSSNTFYYTSLVPVSIQDEPVKTHRGIMLDTSRNYYSVAAILRTIDGCAASKLNVLHLHITDAQSWPLEIEALPELSAKGAYRPDYVYTPSDIVQIQLYGAVRGVQVMLEIDQPEHTAAIGWAYPELLTAYNYEPYTWYCAEPPCGSLRLNDSAVDTFMDIVMGEITKRVYPYTAYFHVGGDEVTANDTLVDPSVGTNATDVIAELLQTYTDKSFARVRGAGLTPIVWEEIPLDWNVTLGDAVVQAWLGLSSVESLTDLGYKVIDSNYNYLVPLPLPHVLIIRLISHSTSTVAVANG